MGNCLKHQTYTTEEEGDEWDFHEAEDDAFAATNNDKSATKRTTEVKIKITKKQLEELLSKMDVRELRVEQVLSHLKNNSSGGYQQLQRSWRPALQSIPEVN